MKDCLEAADTEKVLQVEIVTHRLREEGIGSYYIWGLTVDLYARRVEVVPVAFRVIAAFEDGRAPARRASGRVDLKNGGRKYVLYRFVTPDGDRWMMVDDRDFQIQPMDSSTFEAAMLRLLG